MFAVLLLSVLVLLSSSVCGRFSEDERIAYWHSKGYTWPPSWHEETEAKKAVLREQEAEIMAIPGARERWENWMQFVEGQLVPKFTEHGFELVQTPPYVHRKLLDAVTAALDDFESIPDENDIKVIYSPLRPKFINIGNLAGEVMEDLRSMHEEWAGGIKLEGTSSYGIRFYQNGSSLVMHRDKVHTHVISSIVHVAHEYDNDDEPWPIQIEDHDGKIHSVSLQPGQMLFYESARQLHGRMSTLKGKYYGSLFVHYQPVDRSLWNFTPEDVINAVPPHWSQGIVEEVGSRWAGQGLTIDRFSVAGSPPRVVKGTFVHDKKSPYAEL